jgi:hypothetical protein
VTKGDEGGKDDLVVRWCREEEKAKDEEEQQGY